MNFLLKHLLNYFLFAGTMMFAAGAVDLAGAADADNTDNAAAADAALPGDGAAGEDGLRPGAEGADPVADGVDQPDPEQLPTDGKLDARTLPPSVKTTLAELQAKDPKAHAWLKDRLWAEKRFRDEVPGGLEEVKQLRSSVTGLKELVGPQHANSTPEQIISAVKAEVSEWRTVDAMLEKGDANVLATIAEQFPDGFKKLLPLAVNEFATRDLPGFQKWGASMIDGELQNGNIFGRLAFIDRLLAKNDVEGVKAELAGIKGFFDQYKSIAAKKLEEPAAADPKLKTREQELNTREQQMWVQETSGPINREKTSLVKSAVQQYVPKGETLDDETLAAIEVHVNRFLDPLLQADPNFGPTFKTFEQNRDAEGMKKFILSKIKDLLSSKNVQGKAVMGPAEKATRLFFRQAPKPVAKPGTPGAKPGEKAAVVAKGWIKVAPDKAPAPHEIDKSQTSFEMSFSKAAILRDGRKVFWGDKAPA